MTNFNFYKADSVYGNLFFQFPKVLMYGEQYRGLSPMSKLAYMVLKDRLEYSLRNHWVDDDGNIYFIFTNGELQNLFDCSKQTVVKIKNELEAAGLLYQKAMHFNPKTMKNEPNHLYLADLDVSATDVYLRDENLENMPQTQSQRESLKNGLSRDTVETQSQRESLKNRLSHKSVDEGPQTRAQSESLKNRHNLDNTNTNLSNRYSSADTLNTDTPKSESEIPLDDQSAQSGANLNSGVQTPAEAAKYSLDAFAANANAIDLIARNSDMDATEIKNVIFRAKQKAVKDAGLFSGQLMPVEAYPKFISETLSLVATQMKSDQGISNLSGYIFTAFYKGFAKYCALYNKYSAEYTLPEELANANEDVLTEFARVNNIRLVG